MSADLARDQAVIIGTGGHAQMLWSVNQELGVAGHQVIGWLEAPDYTGPETLMDLPVWIQTQNQIDVLRTQGCTGFLFGIGSVQADPKRWDIYTRLCHTGMNPLTLKHPSAMVSSDAQIGAGVFIGANAVIQPFSEIGDACIVNTGAIIEHHVLLEHNVHAAPGSILCGQVRVGANSLIGAGSVVIQGLEIGEAVTIGAGATVVRSVASQQKVLGNPAR